MPHPFQYSYFLGCVVLFLIWLFLFFLRKDLKKEMVIMSFLFGLAGPIVQLIYTIDYWTPITLTLTRIGFEDFFFGFCVGGIGSVIYKVVFCKKLEQKEANNRDFLIVCLALAFLFFGSFFILRSSFYSSVIAFFLPTVYMWIKKKELIVPSIASGFLLMLISFLPFIIVEILTPGWVQAMWYLKSLDIIILRAPLGDIIWFFLAGNFIGSLYQFWKNGKLKNLKKKLGCCKF